MAIHRLKLILHLVAVAVLILGYGSAVLIWRGQAASDQIASGDGPLSPLDSRQDTRQTEVMYGKSGLVMERWTEFLQSLTHGKNLAKTIIVLSSVVAIGCFFVAGKMPRRPRV